MAVAMTGRSVLLTWNSAAIAGVREKSVALNGTPIDVTADDDAGWRKLLTASGEDHVDIDLSGVTKSQILKSDFFAGTRTRTISLTYPSGGVLTGSFYLASYSEKGPFKDAVTFDAKFQSTGPITWTPGGS